MALNHRLRARDIRECVCLISRKEVRGGVKSADLTTALSHTSCPSAVSRLCLTRLSLGCASLSSISASAARDDGGADGGEVGGRNRRGHLMR